MPLTLPRFSHAGEKLAEIVDCAYVIGFNFPCCTSCFTRPGCATSAMSGGLPPAMAVDNTVGMSLPFDE